MANNGNFPSWLVVSEEASYWSFNILDQATAGEIEVELVAADATNSVSATFKITISENSPVTLTGVKFPDHEIAVTSMLDY